ncbi:MAG: NAD-dependent protein deacylase, partial [Halobacteriovoraceae bacterium]|nr:NAD-dependent protein deacylase [Halobacteriovoraceae bacterium]
QESGNLRPHIVWFGEIPFFLDHAFEVLSTCDLFISVGTSGHVYPAAQFVAMTHEDCHRIEVNLSDTFISSQFHDHHTGMAATVLPLLVQDILDGKFS